MLELPAAAAVLLAVHDVRKRKLPNAVLLPLAASGLILRAAVDGAGGLASGVLGIFGIFLLLYPVFLLRMMGAGDVKLMMALAAFCGWPGILDVLLLSLAAGAVAAAIHFLRRRDAIERFSYLGSYLVSLLSGGDPGPYIEGAKGGKLPFAVFAAAGMLVYAIYREVF